MSAVCQNPVSQICLFTTAAYTIKYNLDYKKRVMVI